MEINDIIFKYKNITIILTAIAPKTFRFNVFKDKILLGEIKWSYVYHKYKLFRVKKQDISDEDWEFVKFCMEKMDKKFRGGLRK